MCVCVFGSIVEAGVFCSGVYVSMYACGVRQGGSEPATRSSGTGQERPTH